MADLITLEEYKAYRGTSKTDNDDRLTFLIASVSALIKAYVGFGITDNWDTPIEETISLPYDSNTLYLNAYPVREIVSVEENLGGYVGGLDSTIHYPAVFNVDYTFEVGNGTIRRIGGNWARNVTVRYKAGYETTPPELKLAAYELVSYYDKEDWKPTRTMQGASLAGPAPETAGIPKHILPILDNYKVGL